MGYTPREDGRIGRRFVHLNGSGPAFALIRRVAIVDVVVVTVDGVDVACIVNAHVDELVTVADLVVGVGIHLVIGEGLSSISRNAHPDIM